MSSSSSSSNIQPKIEPGSIPPGFISMNPDENLDDKMIEDLVSILCGRCRFETFDRIKDVLMSRDMRLRQEIQRLRQTVDWERQKLHYESMWRSQGEVYFRKMEELYEREKTILQENYDSLLEEVKKLKEKSVDDENEIEMLREKNDGLELEVLGLRKMKGKREEDDGRKMVERLKNDTDHSVGVAAGIQFQNEDAHGASSGKRTMNLEKKIEIINLDDDDDDDDDEQCMSRGVHEKKAVSGIARRVEDPTTNSSVAWQHVNPFDMVKRKNSFSSDSESSSSSSSDDSSFLDNFGIWSAVSHAKKRKM